MSAPEPLAPAERTALLQLARAAVRHQLGLGPAPELPAQGPLTAPRGAFVTHRVAGDLRGCIGSFEPIGTLAQTVASMAVSAAMEDPRFPPLTAAELDRLSIHVSALSPRTPVPDPEQPERIVVGRDGLLLHHGWHRGALLPSVAVEHGWDRLAFLKHVCIKAGLSADAWRDPEAKLEVFQAEEFGEP
jgi:AmmeMemoRadiSam system protein A